MPRSSREQPGKGNGESAPSADGWDSNVPGTVKAESPSYADLVAAGSREKPRDESLLDIPYFRNSGVREKPRRAPTTPLLDRQQVRNRHRQGNRGELRGTRKACLSTNLVEALPGASYPSTTKCALFPDKPQTLSSARKASRITASGQGDTHRFRTVPGRVGPGGGELRTVQNGDPVRPSGSGSVLRARQGPFPDEALCRSRAASGPSRDSGPFRLSNPISAGPNLHGSG